RYPASITILLHSASLYPNCLAQPLSLHDALPISAPQAEGAEEAAPEAAASEEEAAMPAATTESAEEPAGEAGGEQQAAAGAGSEDRKSTRLNSSHVKHSYAVLCFKKQNTYYVKYR